MDAENAYFEWTEELFDPAQIFEKPEALSDLRVVELTTLIMGPVNADYFGEFGAEVIKVELPLMGDTMRYVIPDGKPWQNANPACMPVNRNKHHIGLDVRTPEGKELFRRLVAQSDILVENLRAGTMDRWGLGYRQLAEINPGLIYVADSGFGQWGPFSVGRASYDGVAQVASGMSTISGFPGRPPLKIGVWIGDYFGGLLAAVAVLAALEYRERTGRGQFIDFAQSEGLVRVLDWTWLYHHLTGQDRERYGNRDVAICPSDIVSCQDGMVAIAAGTEEEFAGLCIAMGRPEWAENGQLRDPLERLKPENQERILEAVRAWAADKTKAELVELGNRYGFAAAPVYDAADIINDEHFRHRRAVWEIDDPLYGKVVDYGPVPKLSESPGRLKWAVKPVGWHNEYVFRRLLGLSTEEIAELREKGVIGEWRDAPGAKPPNDWDGQRGRVF
jgi:crotonobetainyl-CoA:carnitine CoA-transferase CaiB-like acyl-CoA transferase